MAYMSDMCCFTCKPFYRVCNSLIQLLCYTLVEGRGKRSENRRFAHFSNLPNADSVNCALLMWPPFIGHGGHSTYGVLPYAMIIHIVCVKQHECGSPRQKLNSIPVGILSTSSSTCCSAYMCSFAKEWARTCFCL